MINITESAVTKIKEISESEEIGHTNIRVRVLGGGCAGLTFDLYFEDNISELDEKFEFDGVCAVVDPLSYQYLNGATIDYEVSGFAEGFKFDHPDISRKCGCGNSFSY